MLKTSPLMKLLNELFLLIDVTRSDKIDVCDDCKNDIGKRSTQSQSLNKLFEYLTPEARLGFIQSKKAFIKA